MESNPRLNAIRYLLATALDSEEEYVYHGEMSDYARSYAADAADELEDLFRSATPTSEEIDCCIAALADPERIRRGRSKQLLMWLRERSRPILDALAGSADPQLRIFALETGSTSLNPYFHDPLYGAVSLAQRLLDDPDERVRLAAVRAAMPTIAHNAEYLQVSVERENNNPMLALLSKILARLSDPAAEVRAAAAQVLNRWADAVGQETLALFVQREHQPGASEILARARAQDTPPPKDINPGSKTAT